MRKQIEHEEQCALFQWMELNKNKHQALELCFHIPNGGHRHISVARKLKASGVKPGVPDIFLAWPTVGSQWPSEKGFHGLFIEMKSANGRTSPAQHDYLMRLNEAGYLARVCYGWQEAAKLICEYLSLNPKACGL